MKRVFIAFALLLWGIAATAQDPWIITAENPKNNGDYYGVTVANGQLGLFSTATPLRASRLILGGVYDIYGRGRVSNFVHGINMMQIEMKIGSTYANLQNISNYSQQLDMQKAQFGGKFDLPGKASVEYRYMSLRQMPFCCMMAVTVRPESDESMRIENLITADESLKDSQEYFTTVKNGNDTYFICSSTAKTPTRGIEVGASSIIIPDENYPAPAIHHYSQRGTGEHSQVFTVDLKAGKPYTFYIIGSTLSEATHTDIRNAAERMAFVAAVDGPERLESRHLQQWQQLWEGDIVIEGDAQSQQDVHNMLYHTYSFLREGSGLSVSPMGLSGFGYNGHIFWDAETWVYPALLMLNPALAESMIDYRFKRLDEAKRNAYAYGYRGAMFPWESAGIGNEDTPSHNLYGPLEVHVTADVAIGAWQYFQATGDKDWLRRKGYPIISETADFWVSRVEPAEVEGKYTLVNIIGADEWNVNTNGGKNVKDNAYTIGAAKTNLAIARKAAKILGEKENPQWAVVADGLEFEYMDTDMGQVIREHSTYHGETTKQADVSLLAYPLGIVTDPGLMKRNLEYYLATVPRKRTPAMSKSVYSIVYSRLNDTEHAWQYFTDSYIPNLQPPFRVIAEFDGGTNPYFITGAGGTLQTVLMGFAGLQFTDNGIVKGKAAVPEHWKSLVIKGVGPDKKTYVIK